MSIPKSSIPNPTINPYEGRIGLVYARVSSKKQEIEGSGLLTQEERCISRLRLLNVPHEMTFPDTASGGGDFMERPAMRQLLAHIDANPHKKYLVVFDDLSRLAREVVSHIKLRAAFKLRSVEPICLNFNLDETEEGEYAEIILAAGAQLERKKNRRQVIQKQKARLELGYWPFVAKRGYKMVKHPAHGKLAIPDEKDKDVLIAALNGFADGTFVRKMDACRFLVEKGFWNNSAEKRIVEFDNILRSSFYAGFVEYAPWEVSRRVGHHQALISEETFNLIQKRLKNDGRNKRIRVDVSEDFPLRGLVLCANCKEPLRAAWSKGRSKKYPLYVCHSKTCRVYGKSIKKADIESQFDTVLKENTLKQEAGQLVNLMFDRVWSGEVVEFHKRQEQIARQAEERKKKIKQLADAASETSSLKVRKTYEAQIEELMTEDEKSPSGNQDIDLTIPYRTALDKATTLLKNPHSVWEKVSAIEKHRLYYFIFDQRIAYSRESGYRTAEAVPFSSLFQDFLQQNTAPCDAVPCMVDLNGIEPLTSSMPWKRSTKTELRPRVVAGGLSPAGFAANGRGALQMVKTDRGASLRSQAASTAPTSIRSTRQRSG